MRLSLYLLGLLGVTATATAYSTIFASNITENTCATRPAAPVITSQCLSETTISALRECTSYLANLKLLVQAAQRLMETDPLLGSIMMVRLSAASEQSTSKCKKLVWAVFKHPNEGAEIVQALREYYDCDV
jgi:urease accessory protein UreF